MSSARTEKRKSILGLSPMLSGLWEKYLARQFGFQMGRIRQYLISITLWSRSEADPRSASFLINLFFRIGIFMHSGQDLESTFEYRNYLSMIWFIRSQVDLFTAMSTSFETFVQNRARDKIKFFGSICDHFKIFRTKNLEKNPHFGVVFHRKRYHFNKSLHPNQHSIRLVYKRQG